MKKNPSVSNQKRFAPKLHVKKGDQVVVIAGSENQNNQHVQVERLRVKNWYVILKNLEKLLNNELYSKTSHPLQGYRDS